jgi:hypothetical protein
MITFIANKLIINLFAEGTSADPAVVPTARNVNVMITFIANKLIINLLGGSCGLL